MIMDLHRCGDCQKEFDSYENFLIHKLLFEQYKLTIEPSQRIPGLRIPRFVKSQNKPPVNKETSSISNVDNSGTTVDSAELPVSLKLCAVPEADHDQKSESAEVDVESDDNASVWSQTESLRIDESATTKDNLSSPVPDVQPDTDSRLKPQVYCKYCDRCYKNKVVLRVHEETVHSLERPHTCTTCHQAYKTKGSLVRHLRIHTGERPFRCRECGRAFLDSGTLSRHIHRLHGTRDSKRPHDVQVLITRID